MGLAIQNPSCLFNSQAGRQVYDELVRGLLRVTVWLGNQQKQQATHIEAGKARFLRMALWEVQRKECAGLGAFFREKTGFAAAT